MQEDPSIHTRRLHHDIGGHTAKGKCHSFAVKYAQDSHSNSLMHSPPAHVLFMQDCTWACSVGYMASVGSCSSCPSLPVGTQWDTSAGAIPCSYKCEAGLYSTDQNQGQPDICVTCSVLQAMYGNQLPVSLQMLCLAFLLQCACSNVQLARKLYLLN